MPDLRNARQFFFNAWSLILLWFIGGVYIPREYCSRRFQRVKTYLGWKERSSVIESLDVSRLTNHVVIITGGTRGIGLSVVKKLLALKIRVIVGSSSSAEKRGLLEKELCEEYQDAKVSVWALDLSSMKSVQDFVNQFWQEGLPLHVLINNAGIMFEPQNTTDDGFESHLAVNYLGHSLLTRLLLPLLNKTGQNDKGSVESHSRVINVTSCVAAVGTIRLEDFQSQQMYSPYQAYMQSKLSQLMFTYALQGYLSQMQYKVNSFSVHPGVVDTGLHHHVWWAPKSINRLYKSPEEGADCILHAALSPELESQGGGLYLEDCHIAKSSRVSYNKSLQDELWLKTWELLKPWLPEHGSPRWA